MECDVATRPTAQGRRGLVRSLPGAIAAVLIVLTVSGCGGSGRQEPHEEGRSDFQTRGLKVHLLRFDAQGNALSDSATADSIFSDVGDKHPSDIFIIAHGWNNNERIAIDELYRPMVDRMGFIADKHPDLRGENYLPLVIGLRWPSMAWPDEEAVSSDEGGNVYLPPISQEDLAELIDVAFPNATAAEREQLVEFVDENPAPSDAQFRSAITLMATQLESDESGSTPTPPFAVLDTSDEGQVGDWTESLSDPKNAVRVFTYWQMKARAGTVGVRSLQPVLKRLMERYSGAKIHLVGHSFGAKLQLSACRVPTSGEYALPRPLTSLLLLQAAISHESFAGQVSGRDESGGFRDAFFTDDGEPKNVGLVVATFSDADRPLSSAYPWASWVAGHHGSDEDSGAYAGMGAVGIHGVGDENSATLEMKVYLLQPWDDRTEAYKFDDGKVFYSVNGKRSDGHYSISNHGDVTNVDVAWLAWHVFRAR